ncbi:hypothetical protein F4823DRAFT_627959 [Ustulina deusta]|nr:hypothetical protein F4823DRAFT_627959 [Ustulina deusta]
MNSKVSLFKTAMQKVYGPYDLAAQPDTTWEPGNTGGYHGRYLWTDAFGVLNFITLSREDSSHGSAYLHLARQLANTVYEVLGREREPPGSAARLPGASDDTPLPGGLRIGKLDASAPDGDGMYHHYLTLWVYALDGHLDDVTGFVVCRMLRDTAQRFHASGDDVLASEIEQYARIMENTDISLSGDPLDLGIGLWLAHFDRDAAWSRKLSARALEIARGRFLVAAANPLTPSSRLHRLAFRKFGACLGIKCYEEGLGPVMEGIETILDIWKGKILDGEDDQVEDLKPTNLVMYVAALMPRG